MNAKGKEKMCTDESHEYEILNAREYLIVEHNDLVQQQRFILNRNAGTSLTLEEEKIVCYLISQIKPQTNVLEPLTFDIKTFCEIIGISTTSGANSYAYLKKTIQKLASRVMWLADRETKTETTVRYIDRASIKHGSGEITIKLDEMLAPYLLNLAGNYFQFSFHNVLAMRSKYGICMYKLLKSYCFRYNRVRFNIEDLKITLDATNYKNFYLFKQKVIEPALKDINTFSDLIVNVSYEKTGRAYTHIIFEIESLENPRTPEKMREAYKRQFATDKAIAPEQFAFIEKMTGE